MFVIINLNLPGHLLYTEHIRILQDKYFVIFKLKYFTKITNCLLVQIPNGKRQYKSLEVS